jgi:hypothetical protein
MNVRPIILPGLVLVTLPVHVYAQNMGWLNSLAAGMTTVISVLVGVLVALALTVFLWGMVLFIANSANDEKRAQGKRKMIWGIVALFVIVSVWGLVNLLQTLLGVTQGEAVAPRF